MSSVSGGLSTGKHLHCVGGCVESVGHGHGLMLQTYIIKPFRRELEKEMDRWKGTDF